MQNIISQIPYDQTLKDRWTFHWGNERYSSQKVYKLAFAGLEVPRTFQWIWKSKCVPRIMFFALLLAVDRLNTKTMLRRRNYNTQAGLFCVLCRHNSEEDIENLFFFMPLCKKLLEQSEHTLEPQFRFTSACLPGFSELSAQLLHGGLPDCSLGTVEGQKCSHL